MWIKPGQLDLTYCTNIHAGESWAEVEASVVEYALPLKQRLAPDAPFALGLRLSALAASELLSGDRLAHFKDFLDQNDLYIALINGFPYGSFHSDLVKSDVFAPDWRDPERLDYTLNLARILCCLLPEGVDGGISTSPLSYKPWITDVDAAWPVIVGNLVELTAELKIIHDRTGRFIHLDIEPEPNGLLETTTELIEFFGDSLMHLGAPLLAARLSTPVEEASVLLRSHIQVCFDVCHMAIQFEDIAQSLERLKLHGIAIGRLQISSALRVLFDGSNAQRGQLTAQLAPFARSIYLHQVIERHDKQGLRRFLDLDEALASVAADHDPCEWRIHFHLPLFAESYGALLSTQQENRTALALAGNTSICGHIEVETYTWHVLPTPLKIDLLSSIERELRWVLDELCTKQ